MRRTSARRRLTDFIVKSVTDLNDDHRLELLAIYASEDSKRTVENALESENFEDVGLEDSKQDNTLLGVTWRWSPGEVAQLRNTFYYRNSDTTGTEGEAYSGSRGSRPDTCDDAGPREHSAHQGA